MEKMKRMSIETLRNEFAEIEKTEQAYYVGKATYVLVNGQWKYSNDLGNSMGHDFLMYADKNGKVQELVMGYGTGESLAYGKFMQYGAAKQVFEAMATNLDVEWGMAIRNDGTAKVYTNNDRHHVGNPVSLLNDSAVTQVVHSHPLGWADALVVSDDDLYGAAKYSQKTWTLYAGGKYRDFDQYGFAIGSEWKTDLFSNEKGS